MGRPSEGLPAAPTRCQLPTQQYRGPGASSAGGKPAAKAAQLADRAEVAARQAGDALTGAASEATAAAANVFLAEGGERQRGEVPPEVAAATAARTGGSPGADAGAKKAA